MEEHLKILTVERPNNDGFYIAGVFQSEAEVSRYIDLYLTGEEDYEVINQQKQTSIIPTINGEYVYQMLVASPSRFFIEKILDPEEYEAPCFLVSEKEPLRILLAARNGADAAKKCRQLMESKIKA